jgi:hypothetical protein
LLDTLPIVRLWSGGVKQYPKLSRMAISILSIPAESSEPERTFSGTRRTCSWDRLRITCKTIEMIEYTSHWLRQGLIRPLHENGMGLFGIPQPEGDSQDIIRRREWALFRLVLEQVGVVDICHHRKSFIRSLKPFTRSFNRSRYF